MPVSNQPLHEAATAIDAEVSNLQHNLEVLKKTPTGASTVAAELRTHPPLKALDEAIGRLSALATKAFAEASKDAFPAVDITALELKPGDNDNNYSPADVGA